MYGEHGSCSDAVLLTDGPPSRPLQITRAEDWYSKQDEFQRQDTRSIHHRENLDERAALIRMRLESMHHELIEMHSEYISQQEQDDGNEEQRVLEYETLCTDACAMGQPLPVALSL